jgi:ribosomal protein S18 acetylase RimI-like enzyme
VSNAIHTRPATTHDTAILAEFNVAMAQETEARQLDLSTVTAGVRGLLENPQAGFYLVAEEHGRVVGSLMVTFEWSDWRNKTFWWIQSVYVHPAQRRRGIFTCLFRAIQAMATSRRDVCGLRLYVEQHNHIAQATYKSLGMDETHYDMYEVAF